jgi:hypothetical protein
MSKTLSRGLAALAVSGLAVLTLSTPASAVPCPYPNEDQDCPAPTSPGSRTTTSGESNQALSGGDTTFAPGESITVTLPLPGDVPFAPGSEVTLSLNGFPLGTFTADAAGRVVATFRIPAGTDAGSYTIEAAGVDAAGLALTYSLPITVAGSGDGGGLPFTGAEVGIASLVGAGLLGAGTIAVAAGRRRKVAPATV